MLLFSRYTSHVLANRWDCTVRLFLKVLTTLQTGLNQSFKLAPPVTVTIAWRIIYMSEVRGVTYVTRTWKLVSRVSSRAFSTRTRA